MEFASLHHNIATSRFGVLRKALSVKKPYNLFFLLEVALCQDYFSLLQVACMCI